MTASLLSSATSASLVRQAGEKIEVTAKLLKKAVDADRDLVQTLLPTNPPAGGLDLRA